MKHSWMARHLSIGLYLVIIFVALSLGMHTHAFASDSPSTIEIKPTIYQFESRDHYKITDANPEVSSFTGIGKLSISGLFNEIDTSHNAIAAYGVESGQVSFSYSFDKKYLDSGNEWYLIEDSSKSFDGRKLDAKIKKGIAVLQSSENGFEWQDKGKPIVDYYNNSDPGERGLYTTSGMDLARGTYYRFITAYALETETKTVGPVTLHEQKYYAEVYEFYLCTNNSLITIHDLSVSDTDLSQLDIDGFSLDLLMQGETMVDGSSTTAGFRIDKMGSGSSVSVNGKNANDGAEFTESGKYTIITTTPLGNTTTQTIYVFSGGNDGGYSTYFNDYIVSGKRVFVDGDYPAFGSGCSISIKATPEDVPALTGEIINKDTQEKIVLGGQTHDAQTYSLEQGAYEAVLYSGQITSGTVMKYTFRFTVESEEAQPRVNYETLMSRQNLEDLASKHYEVVYQTTRGGYIYMCFSDYDEAFAYAYEIERRFVEKKADGLYYKSLENENSKIRYPADTAADKIALTQAVNHYARQNVEISYFNPDEEFSYQTLENDKDLLEELESISIADSLKLFTDEEEKQSMTARVPYLNGYQMIHVADYDVKSVQAYCQEDGKKYTLAFDKPVDEQLGVSSVYTITETSQYGDTRSYDACFMARNETVSHWKAIRNGKSTDISVSPDSHDDITADSVSIAEISNRFDDEAIIAITSDAYNFELCCKVTELKDLVLYKQGNYTVSFVDRAGNDYQLLIHISGEASLEDATSGGGLSYTAFYNQIHLQPKDPGEES